MTNKYYAKVKKIIQENLGYIIFTLGIITLFWIDTPYVIYTPGSFIDLSDRVTVDNTKEEINGTLGMAYVSVVKASPFFVGLSYLNKNWDLVSKDQIKYDDESIKDANEREKLSMEESISNAQIAAFKEAGKPYTITSTRHIITYLDSSDTELKLFDEIKRVEGKDISDIESIKKIVATKEVGDYLTLEVVRKDNLISVKSVVYEEDGRKLIGVSLTNVNEVTTEPQIELQAKTNESGPSGGLMMSLSIYDAISPLDLAKGRKIIGTGTIAPDGTVGAIGGVKYKLIGAVKNKADIFLVPKDNYEEAKEVAKDYKFNIRIISVSSLKEAIKELESE